MFLETFNGLMKDGAMLFYKKKVSRRNFQGFLPGVITLRFNCWKTGQTNENWTLESGGNRVHYKKKL